MCEEARRIRVVKVTALVINAPIEGYRLDILQRDLLNQVPIPLSKLTKADCCQPAACSDPAAAAQVQVSMVRQDNRHHLIKYTHHSIVDGLAVNARQNWSLMGFVRRKELNALRPARLCTEVVILHC